jgi:hypothetical protein
MDSMKKTRLFILGAGFSAGAGIPMTNQLLPDALELMRGECPGIYERIENSAQIFFQNNLGLLDQNLDAQGFSNLCSSLHYIEMRNFGGSERWSEDGDREILTLKYFLSKKIAQVTPENIPDQYLEFAKELDCYDAIITFNWDCLLEKAILAVGKKFTYNYSEIDWCDDNKNDLIYIQKMHGSINWNLGKSHSDNGFGMYEHLAFKQNFNSNSIFYSKQLMSFTPWNNDNDYLSSFEQAGDRFLQPFIILPGIGKSFDVRKLASIWDRPSVAFASRRDVYIIGFSLDHDDFFARHMFYESLPIEDWSSAGISRDTILINPSEKDLLNYNFIPDDTKIVRQKSFDLEDVLFINAHRSRS